jgi:hypothetical protein
MIKSTIAIYRLPWSEDYHAVREDWFIDREEILLYPSEQTGEAAAEEAFHLTNAPEEILTENQKAIISMNNFKGPSLSVGDIVKVTSYPRIPSELPEYYLCKSYGWEKFTGNPIQLLKCMSW